MGYNRISLKMGLVFLFFAVLVLVSVGVTFWGLDNQKVDAVLINLAGRQRMLVQQMTRLALEIESQGLDSHLPELVYSQQTFEQTLRALGAGGSAPYLLDQSVDLPPTTSEEIIAQIDQVEQTWLTFQAQLEIIKNAAPGSQAFGDALRSLQVISPTLVEQSDRVVRLYESQSTAKITTLRWVQIAFLISALALLLYGVYITNQFVIHPLRALGAAAREIGAGDLEAPVRVAGDAEIALLSNSMDEMRSKLLTSKLELQHWTNNLEERVAQRTQELEALNAVSREVGSRLDIKDVMNSVVEKSRQLLAADAAFLCMLDKSRTSFSLQSTEGTVEAVVACDTPAEAAWASQVIESGQAVHCGNGDCSEVCHIVAQPFRKSHLAAPLSIGNRVIGALCVSSRQADYFTSDAASLLTRLANIASIAIENATLYNQVERSAALEERHRIAAEMHDGLAQTLSYLAITTDQVNENLEIGNTPQAKQKLSSVQQGVEQATVDIRRAIASLHDEFPTQHTLQEQLRNLVQEMALDDQTLVWENEAHLPLVLAHQKSEQVLRVVREALINAQKHSRATQIAVHLERPNGAARVRVEDNGIGFNPQSPKTQEDRPHFGLKIMHARAAQLEGRLEIHSQQGQGTQVVLTWPLVEEDHHA